MKVGKKIYYLITEKELNLSQEISALTDSIRKKLIKEKKSSGGPKNKHSIKPFLQWDFENGLKDQILGLNTYLKNGAKVENGKLIFRKGGYAITDTLPIEIAENTFCLGTTLDNLKQRAGGVITIQNSKGNFFDSIVFAEKDPRT